MGLMKTGGVVVLWAIALALPAMAQTFEVVSIKPNHSDAGGNTNTMDGRFEATNVGLRQLLGQAFGIRFDQISGGPAWMDSEKYDVIGKQAGTRWTAEALQSCVQAMLADRFQFKFHRETKELAVYSLVVSRGGPRLKDHVEPEKTPQCTGICQASGGRGVTRINFTGVTMKGLADLLGRVLARSVVDNTGLTGKYDFGLEWSSNPDVGGAASIFTAVQEQLGLRLENSKGPVEIIVIDSVQKPSEN
jgi:uncharacterized protein (TIGR03435 family)